MTTGILRRILVGKFSLVLPVLNVSIVGLLTVGCGSRPDSAVYDIPVTVEPLVVTMGGFNSCGEENPKKNSESIGGSTEGSLEDLLKGSPGGSLASIDEIDVLARGPLGMGLFRPFKDLSTILKEKFGVQARYIISCFESGSVAKYRTSDSPDELKTVDPKDFPKLIATTMRRGSPVYLIGHSHGGWLSLQNTLALAEEVTVDGLFSSDPISRIHCRPPAIHGCTGFPADIDRNKQIAVKGATEFWLNAWQTNTFYLHSGPSDHADENVKIKASHTSLDTHADFWNKVNAKITENL